MKRLMIIGMTLLGSVVSFGQYKCNNFQGTQQISTLNYIDLYSELTKLIKKMPKWIPAYYKGLQIKESSYISFSSYPFGYD